MYARGISVRDIQAHLAELCGAEVSPDLISRVTDAVLDEVKDWQSRVVHVNFILMRYPGMTSLDMTRLIISVSSDAVQ